VHRAEWASGRGPSGTWQNLAEYGGGRQIAVDCRHAMANCLRLPLRALIN